MFLSGMVLVFAIWIARGRYTTSGRRLGWRQQLLRSEERTRLTIMTDELRNTPTETVTAAARQHLRALGVSTRLGFRAKVNGTEAQRWSEDSCFLRRLVGCAPMEPTVQHLYPLPIRIIRSEEDPQILCSVCKRSKRPSTLPTALNLSHITCGFRDLQCTTVAAC